MIFRAHTGAQRLQKKFKKVKFFLQKSHLLKFCWFWKNPILKKFLSKSNFFTFLSVRDARWRFWKKIKFWQNFKSLTKFWRFWPNNLVISNGYSKKVVILWQFSKPKIVLFCDLKTTPENIPLFEKNIFCKVLKKVEKNPNIFSKN